MLERQITLHFAVENYCLQLAGGRHFLHEHPLGATSWKERCVKALEQQAGVGTVVADQCQYGLVPRGPNDQPMPAKKATCFLSSAPAVLEALGQLCDGKHRHQVMEGSSRAAAAPMPRPAPVITATFEASMVASVASSRVHTMAQRFVFSELSQTSTL